MRRRRLDASPPPTGSAPRPAPRPLRRHHGASTDICMRDALYRIPLTSPMIDSIMWEFRSLVYDFIMSVVIIIALCFIESYFALVINLYIPTTVVTKTSYDEYLIHLLWKTYELSAYINKN